MHSQYRQDRAFWSCQITCLSSSVMSVPALPTKQWKQGSWFMFLVMNFEDILEQNPE